MGKVCEAIDQSFAAMPHELLAALILIGDKDKSREYQRSLVYRIARIINDNIASGIPVVLVELAKWAKPPPRRSR